MSCLLTLSAHVLSAHAQCSCPAHSQIQLVQSGGSRGLRVSSGLSFSAAQVFTECELFPEEFSLVATFKLQPLRQKRNEWVLSLLEGGPEGGPEGRLLLGLRVSRDQLHFLYQQQGTGRRRRVTFREVSLDDARWHTLSLAVTGHYFTLTVDCGPPLEISQSRPFPSTLTTRGAHFYVGRGAPRRGLFSGLLRQLVLLPGSDASLRLCPSSEPSVSVLSVPTALKGPVQMQGEAYPYEAEVQVTGGPTPVCTSLEQGQLWFNTALKALSLCDGNLWSPLLHSKQRLDYVENYQDLYTNSETFDVEVFTIPNEGLFLATANRDSRSGSGIYKWILGSFQKYQNISTHEARAWKHFTISAKHYLVVANSAALQPERSALYRWSPARRRFVQHQSIETHLALDWEAFHIHNHSFLVVANHRRAQDSDHNIYSVIYRWNPLTKRLEVFQKLRTVGAYDWEFFSVQQHHFLVVANTFDGRTTSVSSTIFIWSQGHFQHFQDILTQGAVDWEAFSFEGRYFLAVANSQRVSDRGPSDYSINSTVYELNPLTLTFQRFQDILTHSAVDWEFFTVGDERFLVVGNSHDGSSYSLNSVIYRWQGYEGFVPVHILPTLGCRDWEHFSTTDGSFLVYSSATSTLSKVFRLKTY
ncbi:thrombospondin-type laminin G domain and EAR repeat-containing protein-like [Eucyclogobius newberryi]|uniref:thrombospondin-type laminin G domain and EAR repeat-containing protein-like n=1 Tax=Eucyclogobius newberryi TaxID=166745 RepID=UPI003B5AE2E3